jgi:hypothetical protein
LVLHDSISCLCSGRYSFQVLGRGGTAVERVQWERDGENLVYEFSWLVVRLGVTVLVR